MIAGGTRRFLFFIDGLKGKRVVIINKDLKESEKIKSLLIDFGFEKTNIFCFSAISPADILNCYESNIVIIDIDLLNKLFKSNALLCINAILILIIDSDKIDILEKLNPLIPVHGILNRPIDGMLLYFAIFMSYFFYKRYRINDEIINKLPDYVLVKDKDFKYFKVSESFKYLVDENIVGKSDFDIFPAEISAKFTQEDKYLQNGIREVIHEEFYYSKRERWFDLYKTALRDENGKFLGILMSIRDITGYKNNNSELRKNFITELRKKNEVIYNKMKDIDKKKEEIVYLKRRLKELEEEKELVLNNVLNNINQLLLYIDIDFNIRWVSKPSADIFGLNDGQLIGKRCNVLGICREICNDGCPIYRALNRGVPCKGDFSLNNYRWLHIKVLPVNKGENRPKGVFVVIEDTTEKNLAYEKKVQTEKMEALGRLTAGIVHDFNNILTVIKGYSEMLLEEINNRSSYYEDIKEIFETSKKAVDLIEQLKIFYRQDLPEKKIININELVISYGNFLKRLIRENIVIDFDLNKNVKPVRCSETHIQQILINLVLNADEAMPEGGRIKIRTDNVHIEEDYSYSYIKMKEGDYVLIEVNDNGVGMDRDVLSKIFEPFYTTKKKKGTGLGLSTVYGIVKYYNGGLFVESIKNHGTSFKIYLPAVNGNDNIGLQQINKIESIRFGKEKSILIVDDSISVARYISKILQKYGFLTVIVTGAKDAIQVIEDNKKIALSIIDMVIPDMSGYELFKKLKAVYKDMKVIFMSGYPEIWLKDEQLKEFIILEKPIDEITLIEKIKHCLEV